MTFTPSDDGATSIDVSGNTFTDSVGNVNAAASQFNWIYDATRPSMTILGTAVGNGGSTNNNPITVTFTSRNQQITLENPIFLYLEEC